MKSFVIKYVRHKLINLVNDKISLKSTKKEYYNV